MQPVFRHGLRALHPPDRDRDAGFRRRAAEDLFRPIAAKSLRLGDLSRQETLELSPPRYVRADGSLDAELLMTEFQGFFRRHSEHWRNRFAYEEAWPQLLLQAYLQRVVNGGGRIEREYALGSGRVDLLIV